MKRAAPLLAAIAACGLFLYKSSVSPDAQALRGYRDAGEILLHRVMPPERWTSARMPLTTLGAAALGAHCPLPLEAAVLLLALAVAAALLAVAALLPGTPPLACGAALALLALAGPFSVFDDVYSGRFYALSVLLTAGAVLWRARSPTLIRALALALAIGASLQLRSPLFLLGPLLAALEWTRLPRRERLRQAAVLCLVPYIFLLPWLWMNWRVLGHVVPFEYGTARSNIFSAVFGLTQTVEGDALALARGFVPGPNANSVFGWALAQIAKHPTVYLAGLARRLRQVLLWQPLLCALGAAGLWRRRTQTGYRALGVVAAYFVAVHCLLAIEPRYFTPLWPLLCVLALGLFPQVEDSSWNRAAAARLLTVLIAAITSASLAAEFFVLRYASALGRPENFAASLEAPLAAYPGEAWLQHRGGLADLAAGRLERAALRLKEASRLEPRDLDARLDWARAELLRGDPRPLRDIDAAGAPAEQGMRILLAKARAEIDAGRRDAAGRRIDEALRLFLDKSVFAREGPTSSGDAARTLLRSLPNQFVFEAVRAGGIGPAAPRLAYYEEVAKRLPPGTDLFPIEADKRALANRR